jgi:hypothetical protein
MIVENIFLLNIFSKTNKPLDVRRGFEHQPERASKISSFTEILLFSRFQDLEDDIEAKLNVVTCKRYKFSLLFELITF